MPVSQVNSLAMLGLCVEFWRSIAIQVCTPDPVQSIGSYFGEWCAEMNKEPWWDTDNVHASEAVDCMENLMMRVDIMMLRPEKCTK
jgi:hypothetical protein